MNPVALALCGCGWVVRQAYAPVLRPMADRFDVAVVFDPDPAALEVAERLWPRARRVTSFEALLDERFDAALVAGPNASHLDQTVRLLRNGRACLVEKPVLRDEADLAALAAAAFVGGSHLVAATACRHRADVRFWLDQCRQIAPLRRIDLLWHRHDGIPARAWQRRSDDGWTGVVPDLGTHLLDIAGAALDWPEGSIRRTALRAEVDTAESAAALAVGAARWHGAETAVPMLATPSRCALGLTVSGIEVTISVRWRDETAGDLVRLSAVGDNGSAVLEGLFGFSDARRVPWQRVERHAPDAPMMVRDFQPGVALQRAGFAAVLRDFAARLQQPPSPDSPISADLAFLARAGTALRA
ncbi:Gfo/Idh/MocA family protein [Mangrovicella endophytica]|uniref:Gfo/Idh/MocA family protein n=1 Tax=Mangrovicella endophytica TaxID=2066697 RepID=UPI000C9E518F|nr:Gfo/Idh/MocA family oxidoreductase [Mangrovicella endophytica]